MVDKPYSVARIRWADGTGDAINCEVVWSAGDEPMPFTASKHDTMVYGVELFTALKSGEYGRIKPAQERPEPARTIQQADIWHRATDAEAEYLEAVINGLVVRLRNMWRDSNTISSDDELHRILLRELAEKYGDERAGKIING